MVLYNVTWIVDNNLTKGKGRLLSGEHVFGFNVLCDSSSSALRCLQYCFVHHFSANKHNLTLDDGVIKLSRSVIDSRGFCAQYLLLNGMREPIYLTDPASNLLRADKIFGLR